MLQSIKLEHFFDRLTILLERTSKNFGDVAKVTLCRSTVTVGSECLESRPCIELSILSRLRFHTSIQQRQY
jgi:hypothetical protein